MNAQSNKWDQRYGESEFAYGTTANDFLKASVHRLSPAGDVLCLAEGEGRNSVFLAQQGFNVTAVDSSSVGLKKAETLAAERGASITTCVADLVNYKIAAGRYDAIISIFCHLPQPLRTEVHKKVLNGLKCGGIFVLEGYTPRQLQYKTGGPPVAELLMELDELKAELGSLDLVHATETEREVHEGFLHTGLGSVVQIIGIKN
ncbi:MAG: class I SAM-dependent methyltransferase [Desulfobulbaceae bacterium]|nr:class I SAM-dependent methyltransferase [Desulfobulbaceae bacterium]